MKTIVTATLTAALFLTTLAPVSAQNRPAKVRDIIQKVNQNQKRNKKLTGADLPALIKSAGFTVKSSAAQEASFDVKHDGWTLPFILLLTGENDRTLWIAAILDNVENDTDTAALLKANFSNGPAQYSVDPKTGMIYLGQPMRNFRITADVIREEVDYMAALVTKNSNLWFRDNSPKEEIVPNNDPDHIGIWKTTNPSGEGLVLTLKQNGQFVLEHDKGTELVTIEGNYTIDPTSLNFKTVDNEVINGSLEWKQTGQFQFKMDSGTILTFTRDQDGLI